MTDKQRQAEDYIVPLAINGLEGRLLYLRAQPQVVKKREILFIYGHHSSLERWWGLIDSMSAYGTVTMPDLPGFGGMDSFYKIGQQPTIDNLADYLAAFIKWRFRRKKFVLAGMSFGFVVATRMLQKYPELTGKVELLISIVGFVHHDDFIYPRRKMLGYRAVTRLLASPLSAALFRRTLLTAPALKLVYGRAAQRKFDQASSPEEVRAIMATEIDLWQRNDVRSHWSTTNQFLRLDLSRDHIDLPVWHVMTENDHFFNHTVVEQHMRMIFSDFHGAPTDLKNHAPSVIADAEAAAPLIPANLLQVLSDLP